MTKNKDQKKAVLEKIQVYLRFRAHSEHELKCKLLKHFDLSFITEGLEEAKEQGWLPEPQKLAEQLAEEWHRKKKGHLLILSALRAKHLPLVPEEQEKEEEKCLWWLKKKHPNPPARDTVPPARERQKISRFLMQKGFESETIKNSLQKYFKDRE